MISKTENTVRSIKEAGNEILAWEGRVTILQNEAENLKRKNDQVKKEIESALTIAQQELDKKRESARQETERLSQEKTKMDAEKAALALSVTEFKKERNEFEREKSKILDLNLDTKRLRERLDNFILLIKRNIETL